MPFVLQGPETAVCFLEFLLLMLLTWSVEVSFFEWSFGVTIKCPDLNIVVVVDVISEFHIGLAYNGLLLAFTS